MGAITFVQALEEHIGGDIEAVSVRTIGIKNIDVPTVLGDTDLPLEVRTHTQLASFRSVLKSVHSLTSLSISLCWCAVGFALQLFLTELQHLRPAAVEELLLKHCPALHHRIVCIADRKLYRQAARQPPFLL